MSDRAILELRCGPGAGRLPAPLIEWPIPQADYEEIAAWCRSRGICLALWNGERKLVRLDEDAAPFWQMLTRTDVFRAELDAFALECFDAGGDRQPAQGIGARDLIMISVPIRIRRRMSGLAVAMFVSVDSPGEALQRLCSRAGLDFEAMRTRWPAPVADPEDVAATLRLTVGKCRELESARQEISNLTSNLQSTYEELHLIYEISRQMGIPQKPTSMLRNVGHRIREVTRVAGIAFVLPEHDTLPDSPGGGSSIESRVVQVGDGAPTLDDLLRLTEVLRESLNADVPHLLINEAASQSRLNWATGWLRHLIALPMREDDRHVGFLFAINCTDDGDFTSVDVQLLRAVADRATAALENQHLYDDLTDLLMGLLHSVVNSVDAKDPYTFGHSERVAFYSRAIARGVRMPAIDCERVYLSGLLHDVGKIGVPDAILTKPGKLTNEEFDALKKHPEIGERILSRVRQIRDLLPGVLYHHERMDGRGYPHKLAGRDIPILGRIICLADSFDAMTSNRTYRAALPVSLAVSEIRRCAGNQFDPELADAFLRLDPHRLFREASDNTGGDPNIGRIGALCAVLGGHPKARMAIRAAQAAGDSNVLPAEKP